MNGDETLKKQESHEFIHGSVKAFERVRRKVEADARTHGYYLNPDPDTLRNLLQGLKENEERYGYQSCPCRLASGVLEFDRDIICPCDYRDPDVAEYGTCYCSLFVRKDVYEGKTPLNPIPERRPVNKQMRVFGAVPQRDDLKTGSEIPVAGGEKVEHVTVAKKLWYCKQCGYVVFREDPPYVCPICKAKREMFARLEVLVSLTG